MTRKLQKIVFALLFLLVLLGAALVGLALLTRTRLPERLPQTAAAALGDTANTALGRAVVREMAGQTRWAAPPRAFFRSMTGATPLPHARCWPAKPKKSSMPLLHLERRHGGPPVSLQSLLKAANRGVRVRLLLDDNNTQGLDAPAGGAGPAPAHGGAPVQHFMQRKQRTLGFLSRFLSPEPAHAQQVVYRGRANYRGGRAQCGRCVLRSRQRHVFCRSRCRSHWPRGAIGCAAI